MNDPDLEIYCLQAEKEGALHAKQIPAESVVTAAWTRFKCQFGCPAYDTNYCCPPYTPTADKTREIISCYRRGLLFHFQVPGDPKGYSFFKDWKKNFMLLLDLEKKMFKDGYYKVLLFLAGPCLLCRKCEKLEGSACKFPELARPSMEGCGIDVFQTVRNNGFQVEPLCEKGEDQNVFCLMLVD